MKTYSQYSKYTMSVLLWTVLGTLMITSVDARTHRGDRRDDRQERREDRREHRSDRRDDRQDYRKGKRVVRRVVRRHHYGLPKVYRTVVIRGHRYYYWNGCYHYPYYIDGRWIYVELNIVDGSPILPPSVEQIKIEINL